jgi:HEPN domain-containing protein
MDKKAAEWLKQAQYDMATARFLLKGGRHFYAVFMCHLSLEKALKGLHVQLIQAPPPKLHDLLYFVRKAKLDPPAQISEFLKELNEVSVATRYPEDLREVQKEFSKKRSSALIRRGQETLKWLTGKYSES